jgi:hypothetical protein
MSSGLNLRRTRSSRSANCSSLVFVIRMMRSHCQQSETVSLPHRALRALHLPVYGDLTPYDVPFVNKARSWFFTTPVFSAAHQYNLKYCHLHPGEHLEDLQSQSDDLRFSSTTSLHKLQSDSSSATKHNAMRRKQFLPCFPQIPPAPVPTRSRTSHRPLPICLVLALAVTASSEG